MAADRTSSQDKQGIAHFRFARGRVQTYAHDSLPPAPREPRRADGRLKERAVHLPTAVPIARRALVRTVRQLEVAERGALPGEEPPSSADEQQVVAALTEGLDVGPFDQQVAHFSALARGFASRRALLAGALTTGEVAALYGASRQMPLDRLRAGTLLGVRERGDWRFPSWQFDPHGPDGVVGGLPQVLAALPSSALLRASWLTAWHPALRATPIEALRNGQLAAVLREARAVGAA